MKINMNSFYFAGEGVTVGFNVQEGGNVFNASVMLVKDDIDLNNIRSLTLENMEKKAKEKIAVWLKDTEE